MNCQRKLLWIVTLLVVLPAARLRAEDEDKKAAAKRRPTTSQAWTLDEAIAELRSNPRDVYLQYVALQLARAEDRVDEVARIIDSSRETLLSGIVEVGPFSLFSGALAVHESLQLETMRPEASGVSSFGNAGSDPMRRTVPLEFDAVEADEKPAPAEPDKPEPESTEPVALEKLSGPTTKSHPWKEMLAKQIKAGHKPQVSPLALAVPSDQYFVVFRSVDKLLQATETGDHWAERIFYRDASADKTRRTSERLKRQLAIRTDPITRPFYDMVVEEVAVTGSDLYVRESSDVSVLFRIKQPEVFRLRMDGFLAAAKKARPDAVQSTGKILGVEYVGVTTPDRAVHVFSAYPKPNLHVRSNSKVTLERVLEAIAGKTAGGKPVQRLGETAELKYIRTLMPRGADEEDGLIYLSDPFIRRITGAKVKLTERRRMIAYNHLRMIGHAAMLYRTQFGKAPESFAQLAESGCAPGVFGQGELACPAGGTYELSSDGTTGVSSVFGSPESLVPCCEIPLAEATAEEAREYRQFVEKYHEYWKEYFDPICVRIKVTPQRYRLETLVMPLIDSSEYKSLLETLGAKPGRLDALPAPKENVLSIAFQWDKDKWLAKNEKDRRETLKSWSEDAPGGVTIDPEAIEDFLARGIGNQIGFHLCDFPLPVGIDPEPKAEDTALLIAGSVYAVLLAPSCFAVSVEDAKIVDAFLDELDGPLAEAVRSYADTQYGAYLSVDYYTGSREDTAGKIRCLSMKIGPVRYRLFIARIGNGLYVTNRQSILDDLAAGEKERALAKAEGKEPAPGPAAHAMVQLNLKNAKKLLASAPLARAENDRRACLRKQTQLLAIARAVTACGNGPTTPGQVRRQAEGIYPFRLACPDRGKYEISPDGRKIACSVHGCSAAPRQPFPRSSADVSHVDLSAVTAALTFLEDGLRGVVTIDRKK